MKQATIVDAATGEVISIIMAPADQIAANVATGQIAVDGIAQAAQRYDFSEKKFIDFVPLPPEPAGHYEWRTDDRRWELKADIAVRLAAVADAERKIAALELKQQRPLRELAICSRHVTTSKRDPESERQMKLLADNASERVLAIDREIVNLREIILANVVT